MKKKGAKKIVIYSRDEFKQMQLKEIPEIKKNLNIFRFFIGDVRDYRSTLECIKGVDFIFHAAALKQVPSCEFYPMEAIKTNVLGSENVINLSIEMNVEKVFFWGLGSHQRGLEWILRRSRQFVNN